MWGSAPIRVSTGPMPPRLFALVLPGAVSRGGPRPDRMVARIEHAPPKADRPAFRSVPDARRGRHKGAPAELPGARRAADAAMARGPLGAAASRTAMAAWPGHWAASTDTTVHALAVASPRVAAARRRDG